MCIPQQQQSFGSNKGDAQPGDPRHSSSCWKEPLANSHWEGPIEKELLGRSHWDRAIREGPVGKWPRLHLSHCLNPALRACQEGTEPDLTLT